MLTSSQSFQLFIQKSNSVLGRPGVHNSIYISKFLSSSILLILPFSVSSILHYYPDIFSEFPHEKDCYFCCVSHLRALDHIRPYPAHCIETSRLHQEQNEMRQSDPTTQAFNCHTTCLSLHHTLDVFLDTQQEHTATDVCWCGTCHCIDLYKVKEPLATRVSTYMWLVLDLSEARSSCLGTMRLQVRSLASLSRLRIGHCCELWCRLAAVALIGTPSLGTSICCGWGSPPQKKEIEKKKINYHEFFSEESRGWCSLAQELCDVMRASFSTFPAALSLWSLPSQLVFPARRRGQSKEEILSK